MTSPLFATIKKLFEQGNLHQFVLEYEKFTSNSSLRSLPLKEQLMALYYMVFTLSLLHKDSTIKELLHSESILNYHAEDQNSITRIIVNLIKLSYQDDCKENSGINLSQIFQQSDEIIESLSDQEKILDAEILGFYFIRKASDSAFKNNDKKKALEIIQNALDLQKSNENSYIKCHILIIYGIILGRFDDHDKAISCIQQAREIAEKIGAKERLLASLVILSHFSGLQTDKNSLDLGISYLKKAKELNEEVGRVTHIENNLTLIYTQKGEIDLALKTIQEGLKLYKKSGSKDHESGALCIMADIYYQQGLFQEAKEAFTQALIVKPPHTSFNYDTIFESLFRLLQIALEEKNTELANHYFKEIQIKQQQITPDKITIYEKLGNALLLKNGKRMKDRVKSQEIFEEISNDSNIAVEFRSLAINYIIELILDDYLLLEDENALSELNTMIMKLYNLGQDCQNNQIIIQSFILRARLNMIEDNFTEASKVLGVAKILASEQGLSGLVKRISEEELLVNESIRQTLYQAKSKKEVIEILKIGSYIQEAQRLILKTNS